MTNAVDEGEAALAAAAAAAAESEERWVIQSSAVGGEVAPTRVLIAPWGEVKSANGTFVVDEESAQSVIEAYTSHGTDLPIDYEHQSLGGAYASPTGQAPAAGWIRALRAVPPEEAGDGEAGLFADVAWTAAAQGKLSAKEYRYLSPVVIVRKRDRRVVALHSAALTNKPAIAGMKPIVNRQETPSMTAVPVPLSVMKPIVNRQETASAHPEDVIEVLKMRLGLPATSGVEEVLVAAEDRLGSLMRELADREARDKVAMALRAGKLTPAQRDWAMALAIKDPAAFDEWSASAPHVVMTGRIAAAGAGGRRDRDRAAVAASARAAYQAEPALALLTSESAWVDDAMREMGFQPVEDCS